MTYGPGPTPSGDPFGGKSFGDPFGGGGLPGGPPIYSAPPPPAPPHTNTLATLSVVFAFVFAPAGAVLGHLGLSQIKRTGQPGRGRAIVGIALSYSIIAITVIALVVTAVLGQHSAPSASSGAPGRTVSAAELPGLLLTVDEVTAIMAQQPGASPSPNLTAQQPSTEPISSPGPQGRVTPDSCTSAMIAGSQAAFHQGNGYRAIYTVTMSQPGQTTDQSITQSVAVFDDATAAQRALAGYLKQIDQCRDDMGSRMIRFAAPGAAQPQQDWLMLGTEEVRDYYTIKIGNHDLKLTPEQHYAQNRALAVEGNVVVDVAVRGVGVISQQQDVITAILDRLK